MQNVIIAVFLCIVAAGCGAPDTDNRSTPASEPLNQIPDFDSIATDRVFAYQCDNSQKFTAYVTKDSTWLFLPDTTLKVLPVEAGSGARYEGASHLYWSQGDKAFFQKPKGAFMNCRTVPEEKAWQAARLRGVDFRALGQEPGWHLEITNGRQIRYIGNYGKDTLVTPVPKPQVGDKQQTVYQTKKNGQTLKVKIQDQQCTDSMSGFSFPKTVVVTINGNTFRGCGRPLGGY